MSLHGRGFSRALPRRTLAGVLILTVSRATSLVSQVPTVSRVRVQYIERERGRPREVVGTLQALTPDSIVVTDLSLTQPVVIPTSAISTLSVSEGMHRHVERGARIGLLAGGATGVLVSTLACSSGQCTRWDSDEDIRGTYIAYTGFLGAAAGLTLGTLIGLSSHEHWRVVIPTRLGAARGTRLRPTIAPLIAPAIASIRVGSAASVTERRDVAIRIGLRSGW